MLNERHLLTCFVSFTFGHWWISRGTTTGIIFNLIQFIWIHLSFSFLFFFKVHVGDRRYSGRHPVRRFLLHAGKSSLVGQQGQVSCRIAGSQHRRIAGLMILCIFQSGRGQEGVAVDPRALLRHRRGDGIDPDLRGGDPTRETSRSTHPQHLKDPDFFQKSAKNFIESCRNPKKS